LHDREPIQEALGRNSEPYAQLSLYERNQTVEIEMNQIRFLKLREVLEISGKSKSSIYEAVKKKQFPAPVKLSNRSSGWIQSEVSAWAEERVKASRSGKE
jgi:prophage regulatory protein